jgi:opacity protein-like surface antigen
MTVAWLFAAAPACCEDSDQTRYYLGFRFGEITPGLVKAHDAAGAVAGLNVGKHLGFELALDSYEVKVGEVSEMSVLGLTPQVRLRYPFLDDRLTPYLIGGVGLAITQANDGRAPVEWRGGKNGVQYTGSLGGGAEYFIADNLALGLEGKYLFSGDIEYTSGGETNRLNVGSALVSLGFRLFYPELHPTEAEEEARAATARFYLALRTGGALLVHLDPFPGVDTTPEQSIFGSNFTQQFGVSAGANIGRYWSVELALDNYELRMSVPGLGGIGEYAVFPIVVEPRFRYPLMNGRLEPYVMGGVGAEYAQINDRSGAGNDIVVFARDLTVIGSVGTGLEYYLLSNVAVGGSAKYIISRDHTFEIQGSPQVTGNFDSFMLSLQIRVFFFNV